MKLRMGKTHIDPSRLFFVGMNYAGHVKELDNVIPDKPVIFMKPPECLVSSGGNVRFPTHGNDLHYETEVVVLIGKEGRPKSPEESDAFISGLSLGLDLTLRDVQKTLKKAGHPWEVAKAFEGSAPIGTFTSFDASIDLENLTFSCHVNGTLRQEGNTGNMIFSIRQLVYYLSRIWTLRCGDLIYTGTPSGVGSLKRGDTVEVEGERFGTFSWVIA